MTTQELRQDELDEQGATQMIEQSEQTEPERQLVYDEELQLLYEPETGEVVAGQSEAPVTDATELGTYLGERIATGEARLAGLQAAKASWIERINEIFDARINQTRRAVEWMRTNPAHVAPLQAAAELVRANTGKQSATIGLVKCKFVKSRESLEIVDEAAALAYARTAFPQAIQVRESILKSAIPAEAKPLCNTDPEAAIIWHPAGETERFEVI